MALNFLMIKKLNYLLTIIKFKKCFLHFQIERYQRRIKFIIKKSSP